ncbi:hypothetical protein NLU13_2402 [Sarocladium strictum]|uniref:Uncharacterized protein n=1 Tax=Sarocladium strictum TaxID=5046 RepID=A0AA39GUB0_SARSR|nr:hypothetical protein NLU13_2402 [Sarocladium strictum]
MFSRAAPKTPVKTTIQTRSKAAAQTPAEDAAQTSMESISVNQWHESKPFTGECRLMSRQLVRWVKHTRQGKKDPGWKPDDLTLDDLLLIQDIAALENRKMSEDEWRSDWNESNQAKFSTYWRKSWRHKMVSWVAAGLVPNAQVSSVKAAKVATSSGRQKPTASGPPSLLPKARQETSHCRQEEGHQARAQESLNAMAQERVDAQEQKKAEAQERQERKEAAERKEEREKAEAREIAEMQKRKDERERGEKEEVRLAEGRRKERSAQEAKEKAEAQQRKAAREKEESGEIEKIKKRKEEREKQEAREITEMQKRKEEREIGEKKEVNSAEERRKERSVQEAKEKTHAEHASRQSQDAHGPRDDRQDHGRPSSPTHVAPLRVNAGPPAPEPDSAVPETQPSSQRDQAGAAGPADRGGAFEEAGADRGVARDSSAAQPERQYGEQLFTEAMRAALNMDDWEPGMGGA